ncbi:MAG: hypothetical protein AUJ92_15880 [Armatimonadetes bacterium CG2_30_59_28]|nr:hypothetical protein [Armatimonadota bacterium]OIO91756.1 MAG: hypothetical protein AUJ92_15880 [Armatimonadetes bacterium CG2_30_59_28]PIU63559.1 MAG: hypothetical protein COS85_15775 [Armatimonadetes bacterium CG07_land_8_20_14_0_80_59_28]PIX45983.1 MAG: hypothetical protein COZ56_00615 [Armatimonadetes bacterium CG_4_8_14_3_um_filter_58_9]
MRTILKAGFLLLLTGALFMPARGNQSRYGKQVRGEITSANPLGRTVQIDSAGTYQIGNDAQILVNGKVSPFDALEAGMAATLLLDPRGSNVIKIMARPLRDGEVVKPAITYPEDRNKHRGHRKIRGIVTGVGADTISINEYGSRPARTVPVANDAAIKVNGGTGSLHDVKTGMKATVTLDPNRDVAVKIQANTSNELPEEEGTGEKGKGHDKAARLDKPDKNEGLGRRAIPGIVVGVGTHTIILNQHGSVPAKTLQVADNADIRVNGTKANLREVKEGMNATVILDYNRDVAVKIQANAHPAPNTGKVKPERENKGDKGKGHEKDNDDNKGHEDEDD